MNSSTHYRRHDDALAELLQHPGIWQAGGHARMAAVGSGWPELDTALPGGGWPRGALTELFVENQGIGEVSLLLPALARLSAEGNPQAWIAPPMLPYAPALAAAGLDLARLLIVQPPDTAQLAWTIEACLRTEGCGAVVAWPQALDGRRLRRLQLAAAASGACGFLFRAGGARRQPSPAALRLGLTPVQGGGLEVAVFKARGTRPRTVVLADMD